MKTKIAITAVLFLASCLHAATVLRRTDGVDICHNWTVPPLSSIAVHNDGSLRFDVRIRQGRVALALCEGWYREAGKRVEILRVEGCAPQTVDTVANIGNSKSAVFWFDAHDTNGDGRIEIVVDAAPQSADKNTILNALWVFPADAKPDNDALLSGKSDARAPTPPTNPF